MSDSYDFLKEYFEKENEERKLSEQEAQIRYTGRRNEKLAIRKRVETAAEKICSMIITEAERQPENRRPEEITAFAASLNHISVALNAMENYAESRPFFGSGLLNGACIHT